MSEQNSYVKFTEHNDWEGETWHFFVPATESNISQLKSVLESIVEFHLEDEFEVDFSIMPEQELDVLIKYDDTNMYMAKYHKLSGVLNVPSLQDNCSLQKAFYKGGIRNMMIADG